MRAWRRLLIGPLALALVTALAGCSGVVALDDDDAGDDDTSGDDDSTGDDDTSGDDDSTGDDDTLDCENLPAGPFNYGILFGPKATEDMAFDNLGNVIGADNGNLFKSTYAGEPSLWVPGAGGFIAGLRAIPSGDIVYADVSSGTMYRIEADTGVRHAVLSGMEYANGIEVDLDGYVYAAEQNGSRVRRFDPITGEFDIVADGLDNPNGVSFSPDYRTLYIGSFGGGTILALPFDEHGNPGEPEVLVESLGNHLLDGMGVDACGNIYVCEYLAAKVWRISPDGQLREPIVDFSSDTEWIPNMQWGSGIGGWVEDNLYVLDIAANKMFEVPLGVPGKERAYP
jgi:hypothetical protein